MTRVSCAKCKHVLSKHGERKPPDDLPCEVCGSTVRGFEDVVEVGGVEISADNVTAMHSDPKDGLIGFEVQDTGKRSIARSSSEKRMSYETTGGPSTGEDGTLDVCRLLVHHLNKRGGDWSTPVEKEQHDNVDCESTSVSDPVRFLRIQVSRAKGDEDLWRNLTRRGGFERDNEDWADLGAGLIEAIKKKAAIIPECDRKRLVLALNALLVPAAAFPPFAAFVRNRFRREIQEPGFQAVWVVGPEPLIERLDNA